MITKNYIFILAKIFYCIIFIKHFSIFKSFQFFYFVDSYSFDGNICSPYKYYKCLKFCLLHLIPPRVFKLNNPRTCKTYSINLIFLLFVICYFWQKINFLNSFISVFNFFFQFLRRKLIDIRKILSAGVGSFLNPWQC